MSKPLGITELAWLSIAGGVFTVSTAIMGAVALALFANSAGSSSVFGSPVTGAPAYAFALWMLILGVAEIALGMGALELKQWAWMSFVTWCYASLFSNLLGMLVLHESSFLGLLVGEGVTGAILYLLYTEEVSGALGHEDAQAPALLASIVGSFKGFLGP